MSLKMMLVSSVLLLSARVVTAQFDPSIEGGQSVTVTQELTLGVADLEIGITSDDNALTIIDNGWIDTSNVRVGGTVQGDDNILNVTNNGTLYVTNNLLLGESGSANLMQVNGAYVYSGSGVIGQESSSDNNEVLLDEGYWALDGMLTVGEAGSGNSIFLDNGGELLASNIVVGGESSASDNLIVISSTNSAVFADYLTVGSSGSANHMTVTNGAAVWVEEDTIVGENLTADDNTLLVEGAESVYWNLGTLSIGTAGNSGNSVTVTNGAVFYVGEGLEIAGSNNELNLDAGGFFIVDTDFNAAMQGFNFNEGGMLGVGGALTGMTNVLEGGRGLMLAGSSALWDLGGTSLYVGNGSSSNLFVLNEDASASMDDLFLGTDNNSFDNAVHVTNSAALSIAGDLQIGSVSNSGNMMTISRGALVAVGDEVVIAGTNNYLSLNSGGWLTVSNDFNAGMDGFNYGAGSTLEVAGSLTGMNPGIDNGRRLILNGLLAGWDTAGSDLYVGSNTANNSLILKNGAVVNSGGLFVGNEVGADNNRVEVSGLNTALSSSGNIVIGGAGSGNRVSVSEAAVVSATGIAIVGAEGDNNLIEVSGTNTEFVAQGGLIVGQTGSVNSVVISGGGTLTSLADSYIGDAAGASGNRVFIDGAGSSWQNTGDLYVGNNGSNSLLDLNDYATLSVGGQLAVQNGSVISFSSNAVATSVGSYFQSADSVFDYDSVSNVSVLVSVVGNAEFEAGATIDYTGNLSLLDVGLGYTNHLVDTAGLIIDGASYAPGTLLSNLNSTVTGSLLTMDFYSETDGLYARLFRVGLADSAGFSSGSQMSNVCNEIDTISTTGDSAAEAQLQILNSMSSAEQNTQLTQLYDQSAPHYMHVQGMLEGLVNIRRRGLLPEPLWARNNPDGAEGPHRYGRELYGRQSQMWIKGYGSRGTRDADVAFSGYDQDVYGTVLGVDKAWGDWLLGIAGGYASSGIDQENGDSSDATTGYGVLYGAWGTLDWFGDANIAYGRSSIDTRTGTDFDTRGSFDADHLAFYLGGGKEFALGNETLLLTPLLALQGNWYLQDAYQERANNAVVRNVESYDRLSVQSVLGVKAGTMHEFMTFVLMPELRLNWLHEFNTDEDEVDYTLAGISGGNYTFGMQAPASDIMEVGLGLSSRHEYEDDEVLEFSLNLDGRMGDGYSAVGGSIRALYEF